MNQILGVKIDNLKKSEILDKVSRFLSSDSFHQIVTVNPEFILKAQKDDEFRNIINQADLNIADGVGLKYAFWRFGEHLKARFSGVDLTWEILKLADQYKLSVFLVASKDGLSSWEETAQAIRKKYPGLEISGVNWDFKEDDWKDNIDNYNILLCNAGAPKQEKFIFQNRQKFAKIRLAMGVGGSFDFISGKVKRAPVFLRFLGLEWIWRLAVQPRRIKRILSAVVIFPLKIIFNKKND